MQRLPLEAGEDPPGILAELGLLRLVAGAIDLVAKKRMAEPRKMHADLVRAAGLQPALHEARDRQAAAACEAVEQRVARDRALAVRHHGHPVARFRIAADLE